MMLEKKVALVYGAARPECASTGCSRPGRPAAKGSHNPLPSRAMRKSRPPPTGQLL
jgi:hypothetical protein